MFQMSELMFNDPPHLLQAQQFTPEFLEEAFCLAEDIRHYPHLYSSVLEGEWMAVLFEEPSTRTLGSSWTAAERLGANVFHTEHSAVTSSEVKGESLTRTVKTFTALGYTWFILRRRRAGDMQLAASITRPGQVVINGGDGPSQHPTQAFLDVYTIKREFGDLNQPLHVMLVGDLKNGRTVHSLVYLLSKYRNVKFTFVSTRQMAMKRDIIDYLDRHGHRYVERFDGLLSAMTKNVDVVYLTRAQLERCESPDEQAAWQSEFPLYGMNDEVIGQMGDRTIFMHPLPSNEELPEAYDTHPRARHLQQMENGLWGRMALLTKIQRFRLAHHQ